jgi:hypothetical protein
MFRHAIFLAFAGVVLAVSLAAAASASPAPSPAATGAATAAPADPCGDTDLLGTTDRPTFGTNPCVVKPQAAIVELGYRNTTTSNGANSARVAGYPLNRYRIGFAPHLELILDLPTDLVTSGATPRSGDSNLGTGLKYEIGYFGSFVHGFAAEAVYPTGSTAFSNGFPSFNGSYQIGGTIARNLGFNLTLGFNSFSSTGPAGGKNVATTAFAPTLIVGGVIAPATKLNVEIANSSSNGPGSSGQYFANVFAQHQVSKGLLIDAEAEQRLTVVHGAHQHYVGAGLAIRI